MHFWENSALSHSSFESVTGFGQICGKQKKRTQGKVCPSGFPPLNAKEKKVEEEEEVQMDRTGRIPRTVQRATALPAKKQATGVNSVDCPWRSLAFFLSVEPYFERDEVACRVLIPLACRRITPHRYSFTNSVLNKRLPFAVHSFPSLLSLVSRTVGVQTLTIERSFVEEILSRVFEG